VALMHLHGKMNQQKRMAMYLDYVGKDAAVMIATDIAARGLDFKGIDWVIQFDAPENVDTYIHRVGRTARYHSEGHAILFLCPSEMPFLERLDKRKIPIERMKVNPSKTQTIQQSLQATLIKEPELKYLAQRALRSYLRSVHIMNDKEVFDVSKLNTEELAYSHGLMQIPNLKFGNVKKVDKNAEIFKSKVETMQRRMDEAEQAKKDKKKKDQDRLKQLNNEPVDSSSEDSDSDDDDERLGSISSGEEDGDDAAVGSNQSDDDEMIVQMKKPKQRKTKLEKLMNKKNTTILSDTFAKMRGKTEYATFRISTSLFPYTY
jgi:ATP-dependent RNA helicase DDX10/DBP4